METTLESGAVIDDQRTDEDKAKTEGFVVATDSFMSGWGNAKSRSLFAVPFTTAEQAQIVLHNMECRSEMKRARIVGKDYRPKLSAGDHLSIRAMGEMKTGFYVAGYFARQEAERRAKR